MPNYRLFFDGACASNPGPGGAGVVVVDQYGLTVAAKSYFLGPDYTNNKAEYTALLFGLKLLKNLKLDVAELEIISDSKLVVEQVRGNYEVKSDDLKVLHSSVTELLKEIPSFKITFMPRKYNKFADSLARKPLTGK